MQLVCIVAKKDVAIYYYYLLLRLVPFLCLVDINKKEKCWTMDQKERQLLSTSGAISVHFLFFSTWLWYKCQHSCTLHNSTNFSSFSAVREKWDSLEPPPCLRLCSSCSWWRRAQWLTLFIWCERHYLHEQRLKSSDSITVTEIMPIQNHLWKSTTNVLQIKRKPNTFQNTETTQIWKHTYPRKQM